VLHDMSQACSPEHTRRSRVAHSAIAKTFKKLHALHDLVHQQEAELEHQEIILQGLVRIPHQLGMVKKDDLN
jgi:hypothetical protein